MREELQSSEHAYPQDLDQLLGQTAFYLDQMWVKARTHGRATEFIDAVGDWIEHSPLPAYFSIPRGVIFDKQQPPLQEAIHETIKRLQFLEKFSALSPEQVAGILCGGSMSYGRFYSIRGGEDPSDIDMFVIVDNEFFSSLDAQRELMHPSKGFQPKQTDEFVERCLFFKNLYQTGAAQFMYHKISVGDFFVSLKVIPLEQFQWEFRDVVDQLLSARTDRVEKIHGYKSLVSPGLVSYQRNFYGESLAVFNEETLLPNGEVISSVPAGIFLEGCFYSSVSKTAPAS